MVPSRVPKKDLRQASTNYLSLRISKYEKTRGGQSKVGVPDLKRWAIMKP